MSEVAVSKKTLARSVAPLNTAPPPAAPSRRRFARQLWGAAAVLACGAGAGAWWYWTRPWRNANRPFEEARDKGLPTYGFEVVKEYDHDAEAFTQGLLFNDGVLYESTGKEG